ncbi:MAG: CoA-binding protein, partial [Chloroflexi bacterium]|nr:CoA-binding protein [Chloroflexota bacterium]
MSSSPRFGLGFPPKNIAIVGVSRKDDLNFPGYTGIKLLRILQEGRFPGHLYPVNPKAASIDGLKCYSTVSSIPERVDLVTVTVPAATVPQVLEDCAAAGVPNVQICTSGFGESGEEAGKLLDERVREVATRGNLRVIGPNCMGFHVPSARMQMFENVPLDAGPVAFLSQSGGHSRTFILCASHFGIGISKVISYGNALLLEAPDYLEYLADDPETKVICMYLEGVRDGHRFTELAKRVNPAKPIIIWKGGHTPSGARAASSHTASLAGNDRVWDAFFKQTGAIQVGSIEEMTEVAMALLRLGPVAGNRLALLGAGGGDSVAAGDIAAEEGLELPSPSPQTREKLLEFVALVNQG